MNDFEKEKKARIEALGLDTNLQGLSAAFMQATTPTKYSYNFSWQGRPIIQYPQDIVAMQELIWEVKPDLIIETGIAHGGSLIFSASMLALLDLCDTSINGGNTNVALSRRKVLAIDIDIRAHNRAAIEAHPMSSMIHMIQGSSIEANVISQVHEFARNYSTVMVCLDSNHTHHHVLAELEAYAPLTSLGSYCVVFDTVVEDMPKEMFPDRSWGPGNNPKTAVHQYLQSNDQFQIDKNIQNKLLLTVAPDGYLRRMKA